MFSVHMLLFSCIVLDIYSRAIFRVLLPYVAVHIALATYWAGRPDMFLYLSTVAPLTYLLIVSVYQRTLKGATYRMFIASVLVNTYLYLSIAAKTGQFKLSFADVSFYQSLVFYPDLLMFTGVLFCIGGEKHHHDTLETVFPESISADRLDYEDEIALKKFGDLPGFARFLGNIFVISYNILSWVFILACCYLGGALIEGFVISSAIIVFGAIIRHRWHSKSLTVCLVVSAIICFALARAVPAIMYSWFLPVLAGLGVIYGMHRLAVILEKTLPKRPIFLLEKYCDFATMKEIAEEKGLTPKEIELLEHKFCKGFSQVQLEVKFSEWSLSSIKRMIKTAKTKFEA